MRQYLRFWRSYRRMLAEPKILSVNNILIAVNGVESSALSGNETVAKTGDVITIVSVVHGGI